MSEITSSFVTSRDGTEINYQTVGKGPSIIVVPGALTIAEGFHGLATSLSGSFMVHVIERRGRGLSGPQGKNYSVVKECDDIRAVQDATNSHFLFGHSYGGFICLEAARKNSGLKKIAVYEPGVSIDGSIPVGWTTKCQEQLEESKFLAAFITFVRGINPESAGRAPAWLLKIILPIAIRKQERLQKYKLLGGTILEHKEEARLDNTYSNYQEITADVLFIQGKDSGALTRILPKLHESLRKSELVTFPKLDHFGPEKHSVEIAEELKHFFLNKA